MRPTTPGIYTVDVLWSVFDAGRGTQLAERCGTVTEHQPGLEVPTQGEEMLVENEVFDPPQELSMWKEPILQFDPGIAEKLDDQDSTDPSNYVDRFVLANPRMQRRGHGVLAIITPRGTVARMAFRLGTPQYVASQMSNPTKRSRYRFRH